MCAQYSPNAYEELLAKNIVECAYAVHSTLGPGLFLYEGNKLPWGVRLDVLVDQRIVCELKSVEAMTPLFLAQILTQLKLVNLHLGFLINFNVALIKDGIRRVII